MTELVVRLVFSLAVVVGLLLLIAKFAGRRFHTGSSQLVQVVHRQSISRNASVSVINVGGRVLVLGTTENEVRLLTELDPETMQPAEGAEPEVVSAEVTAEVTTEVTDEQIEVVAGAHVLGQPGQPELIVAVPAPSHRALEAAPAPAQELIAPFVPDPIHEPAAYVGRRIARPAAGSHLAPDPTPAPVLEPVALPTPESAPEPAPAAVPAVISPAALLLATEIAVAARAEARDTASRALEGLAGTPVVSTPSGRHTSARRERAERASRVNPGDSALAGSVLSTRTWRQAWAAVTGHAS